MLDIADREAPVVLEAAPDCPGDIPPLSDAIPDALLVVEELLGKVCELSLAMGIVPDTPSEEADATLLEVAPLTASDDKAGALMLLNDDIPIEFVVESIISEDDAPDTVPGAEPVLSDWLACDAVLEAISMLLADPVPADGRLVGGEELEEDEARFCDGRDDVGMLVVGRAGVDRMEGMLRMLV